MSNVIRLEARRGAEVEELAEACGLIERLRARGYRIAPVDRQPVRFALRTKE